MGYKKYFQKVLKKRFPDREQVIRTAIEREFEEIRPDIRFSKTSKNPMDRRMEIAGYFLATIKALDRENIAYATIREVVIEIAYEYVRPVNAFQSWRKRVPARLVGTRFGTILLQWLGKKVNVLSHPEGFRVAILTRKEDTLGFGYGFDILECGICKLFQKHNYPLYTSILCEVDFITSGMAGLNLVRGGTIANGAVKCDFRFEKKSV